MLTQTDRQTDRGLASVAATAGRLTEKDTRTDRQTEYLPQLAYTHGERHTDRQTEGLPSVPATIETDIGKYAKSTITVKSRRDTDTDIFN